MTPTMTPTTPEALLPTLGSRADAVDYWAITTNKSSSSTHAFKDGKAICGSPLQASRHRWADPGYVGCKKCVKIWLQLNPVNVPHHQQPEDQP